jgi:hypothetical protein
MNGHHHAPTNCPVCGDSLLLTRVSCENCGTELSGRFARCGFCGLTEEQQELLRVFLVSRGNLKDLQRHLGVSYPTARVRFDELLRALGLPVDGESTGDERLHVLEALARGEIDVDDADDRLRR